MYHERNIHKPLHNTILDTSQFKDRSQICIHYRFYTKMVISGHFLYTGRRWDVLCETLQQAAGVLACWRRRRPAHCPDSNSNSFNPIFTKPGQKLYLDDI